jgi:hypothetical protein
MSNSTVPTITLRAYQLWQQAGQPQGRDEEFYFQAEEELRKLLDLESPQQANEASKERPAGGRVENLAE